MIYDFGIMYRILDSYVDNSIDETEHAYISELKWPNSYVLKIQDEKFWTEIEDAYETCIEKEDREVIRTVADLKRILEESLL